MEKAVMTSRQYELSLYSCIASSWVGENCRHSGRPLRATTGRGCPLELSTGFACRFFIRTAVRYSGGIVETLVESIGQITYGRPAQNQFHQFQ